MDIRFQLTVDESGAVRGLKAVEGGLENVGRKSDQAAAATKAYRDVSVAAAAASAAAFTAMGSAATLAALAITKATDRGGMLADLAARTGVAASALQRIEHAGKLVGVSLETTTGAVSRMQKAVVEGNAAFTQLGLSAAQLRAMKPDEAFAAIGEKIARIPDPAGRAAAAMELFGKSGAELLPLLTSNIAGAAREAERLGLVMSDQTVAAADALGDSIDTLSGTWDGLLRRFGDAFVKSEGLHRAVAGLTNILADFGAMVARNERALIQWVAGAVSLGIRGLAKLVEGVGIARDALANLELAGISITEAKVRAQLAMEVGDRPQFVARRAGLEAQIKDLQATRALLMQGVDGDLQKIMSLAQSLEDLAGSVGQSGSATVTFTGQAVQMGGALTYVGKAAAAATEKLSTYLDTLDDFRRSFSINDARGGAMLAFPGTAEIFGTQRVSGLPDTPGSKLTGAEANAAWEAKYGAKNRADEERKRKALLDSQATTFDATNALRGFADVMQILGGRASGVAQALGMVLGAMSALQGLPRIFGKGGVGWEGLDKNQKMQAGMGALGAGVAAYQSGSVSGGAMGGAAAGYQLGGPWGAAIGGVLGGALGFLGKGAKERKELEELRKGLVDVYGSMDRVRTLGGAMGVSMAAAFSDKNPKAAKAAIEALEKALAKSKSEMAEWSAGIVSAQTRALIAADPKDKDVAAFVRGQREAGLGGLGAGIKGIKIVTPEDARAQAAIVAVNFWDTFKTEGFLKAADAFKGIMSTVQESLAKIGGDEAAAAILGPIQQLVDLGTVNEGFRTAAEGAQGLATNLDSLANRNIPLTVEQYGAFAEQASSAYQQALAAAQESGLGQQEAQRAAIMASAPLLQSVVEASRAYGFEIDANTQALLDQAAASGVAFASSDTDRLRQSIDALTTALGGVPPAFDAVGDAGTRAGDRTSVSLETIPPAIETSTAAMVEFGNAASNTLVEVAGDSRLLGQAVTTVVGVWEEGTREIATDGLQLQDTLLKQFREEGIFAERTFMGMTTGMERELGKWEEIAREAKDDVLGVLAELPSSVSIQLNINGPEGINIAALVAGQGFASGTVNSYFPSRRGGHWLNVSEGGRGEYVTVTHRPVAMLSDGGIIASRRVGRGVTHAAEGYGDMIDLLAPGGGGAGGNVADILTPSGGGGGGFASAVDALVAAAAALESAAEAQQAGGGGITVEASFAPTLQVQETSVSRTRESNEQFDTILSSSGARVLRNANDRFTRALSALMDEKIRAERLRK